MSAIVVVTDAGPLHYPVLIDCVDILPRLFQDVLVPFAVRDELIHPRAPKKVKDWILRAPAWVEVTQVKGGQPLRGLHKGEAEALQLALERKVSAVLMDDMDGRAAARRLGLTTIFTVALLELAAEKGFVELPMMPVVDGMVFVSEFGQERAQSGRRVGWITEFLAEVQIEFHPFVVCRAKGQRNFGLVESALETGQPFCGQFLHQNLKGGLLQLS